MGKAVKAKAKVKATVAVKAKAKAPVKKRNEPDVMQELEPAAMDKVKKTGIKRNRTKTILPTGWKGLDHFISEMMNEASTSVNKSSSPLVFTTGCSGLGTLSIVLARILGKTKVHELWASEQKASACFFLLMSASPDCVFEAGLCALRCSVWSGGLRAESGVGTRTLLTSSTSTAAGAFVMVGCA